MPNNRRNLWTAKLSGKKVSSNYRSIRAPDFTGMIMGIDPSLRGSGFGIIEVLGIRTFRYIDSLTLKISPRESFVDCLGKIFLTTQQFLQKYPIKAVSVESTVYVQNTKIAHILGSARGACLSAVALQKIPVQEFPPLRIKKSIVGVGQAQKAQVAKMVSELLDLTAPLPFDEADATAAALCYFFSLKSLSH